MLSLATSTLSLSADAAAETGFSIRNKTVGVLNCSSMRQFEPLFEALSQLYPVRFRPVDVGQLESLDALVVLDGNLDVGVSAAARGLPSYVVVEGVTIATFCPALDVRFHNSDLLDRNLRGQVFQDEGLTALCPLKTQPGDEIVASVGEFPVWVARPHGLACCQLVAVAPPLLPPGQLLLCLLKAPGFTRLLPLFNFLINLVKEVDWRAAPLRACFIFDDPSLYRPTYGFLDYRLLARHAAQHNYYASVAVVPLDTWWVNSCVSEIFRSSSPRLSILIHGNNHTSLELLSCGNASTRLLLGAQALRRMDRLEFQHQTPCDKVMEPPHAAITYDMFEDLLSLGYEAALSTIDILVRYNPHIAWRAAVGLSQSELLGGGFPVLPRIRMLEDWRNEVKLAAFLRQPVLLAGHHNEAQADLQLLAEFARLVNGFDDVVWASPSEISRSNYKTRRLQDTLHILAFSRRFSVLIPGDVEKLVVHRPWFREDSIPEPLVVKDKNHELFRLVGRGTVGPISVAGRPAVEIFSPPAKMVDYKTVEGPGRNWWPAARKVLTEFRDRSAPLRKRTKQLLPAQLARLFGKDSEW